jgi:hypothetical protein
MASFSQTSKDRLGTCNAKLQAIFNEVVKTFDCTVLIGHRNQADQHTAFVTGHSKLDWPNGNHNSMPSNAVDVAPFPIDWTDRERLTLFAGYVLGVAHGMGYTVRWGGDWNQNTQVKDNSFDDLVHFEIK